MLGFGNTGVNLTANGSADFVQAVTSRGQINATGVAVVLVEQNVQRALELATRAYLLSEGRVRMAGTAAEFMGNPELQRTVLGIAADAAL